ncbi:hypothetical protein AYJ57_21305 (plasmid) [Salipiger sp. CCB-MM3]|nr:hypothetical protein AYJ57_21305 [Salipiger sp. CCB-MM3]
MLIQSGVFQSTVCFGSGLRLNCQRAQSFDFVAIEVVGGRHLEDPRVSACTMNSLSKTVDLDFFRCPLGRSWNRLRMVRRALLGCLGHQCEELSQ